MRDDRGPRTPVAEGTSSPPMTRRSARAAKKAHEGDGNVTPRRERARTAPEAASTALIGDVEFINEEVKKKVETCAKRLDVRAVLKKRAQNLRKNSRAQACAL